jgi:hypothetical protein
VSRRNCAQKSRKAQSNQHTGRTCAQKSVAKHAKHNGIEDAGWDLCAEVLQSLITATMQARYNNNESKVQ